VAKEMQGATFSISEAVWAAGDFRKKVTEAPQRERSQVRVRVKRDNVAGVKLPVFTLLKGEEGLSSDSELSTLGLAGGGRAIGAARGTFVSLLELLVKLGSLQTSFLTLDEAIKVTNRRVNALDNVSAAGRSPCWRAACWRLCSGDVCGECELTPLSLSLSSLSPPSLLPSHCRW
jgi:V-type H+-transporting ATPase subunit D